ncbi:hypothetical protein JCM8547_003379 [Rhodosporidiobolus lusitaniae]
MTALLQPTRLLYERGGAAGGNPSSTFTGTFAATPPSSTYTGPKIAGTYGGFVGVLVGSGIFLLIVLFVLGLWRYRSLRRLNSSSSSGDEGYGGGGVRRWAEENDDAFEMPSSLRTPGGGYEAPYSPSQSTLHLSPHPYEGGAGGGESPRLYANEGIKSREDVSWGNGEARRYADGGAAGEGTGEGKAGEAERGERGFDVEAARRYAEGGEVGGFSEGGAGAYTHNGGRAGKTSSEGRG